MSEALESRRAAACNDFIAVLAHELRNPLAPIRNAVQLLQAATPGDADFEVARRAIDRQSAQLARIVDDLLDIGRITRGTLQHRSRSASTCATIVARAVEAARPGIEAAQPHARASSCRRSRCSCRATSCA